MNEQACYYCARERGHQKNCPEATAEARAVAPDPAEGDRLWLVNESALLAQNLAQYAGPTLPEDIAFRMIRILVEQAYERGEKSVTGYLMQRIAAQKEGLVR